MNILIIPFPLPGLDAAEKKFGGGKVDPTKQRGMNEKITDGARGMFEKATGYVDLFPNISLWQGDGYLSFRCWNANRDFFLPTGRKPPRNSQTRLPTLPVDGEGGDDGFHREVPNMMSCTHYISPTCETPGGDILN